MIYTHDDILRELLVVILQGIRLILNKYEDEEIVKSFNKLADTTIETANKVRK